MRKVAQVPEDIRYATLLTYINKCREVYQIHHFQWRHLYPSENTQEEQIKKLIQSRINYTYKVNNSNLHYKTPMPITQEKAKIKSGTLKKYELIDEHDKPYRINSFALLNFPDPFPNENSFKTEW
jgi:hypothetical protein